jgi:hypothetical protein
MKKIHKNTFSHQIKEVLWWIERNTYGKKEYKKNVEFLNDLYKRYDIKKEFK